VFSYLDKEKREKRKGKRQHLDTNLLHYISQIHSMWQFNRHFDRAKYERRGISWIEVTK